jgi:60 kDa SS-A/Ro ribonucleoprotein
MKYAQHFNPNATPQTEQADTRQVENNQGGFVFTVDKWKRLERFLILGSEGGSYYATERNLTVENAKCVQECCAEDGARAVRVITEISEAGRAPKNDPAVFALALAAAHTNPEAKRAALAALPRVCRIGTHLFQFAEAVNQYRGWGRGLRKAVGAWYTGKTPDQVAFQVAKYGQRNGWSHRDLLRLAHPEQTAELASVFRYIVAGIDGGGDRHVVSKDKPSREYPDPGALPGFLHAFEELKGADEKRTIALIAEHGFTHEMIPSEHKNSAAVWEALLEKMPPGALIRNLAKMTAVGLLRPMSGAISLVAERLTNETALKKARVHPIAMLSALKVYQQGHGDKGSLTWSPVPQIVDALDAGFYAAFGAIEPSGKRMTWPSSQIAGLKITAREASACMALVTARSEKNWHIMGFSTSLVDIPITPRQRLDDVIQTIERVHAGGTDCSLPMLWASGADVGVDMFTVYTDNETAHGRVHPFQALKAYRAKSGIQNAKLAVVGCVASNFTIADPTDAGMLDVVGFDTAAPQVLASFAGGE